MTDDGGTLEPQTDLGPAPDQSDDPSAAPPDDPVPAPSGGRRGVRGCVVELAETLVLTLVIFFVIQNFVAQPFQVNLHSMERTFLEGENVLVDRLTVRWSPYARGQVIVFLPPVSWTDGSEPFIKRVIGVGGDTVEIRDGRVLINGVVLDEPYLFRDDSGAIEPTVVADQARWVVPEGDLFVMGDHRQVSSDSRLFGPIPVSSVIGRAVLRYWPLTKLWIVETPDDEGIPAS
jgi:signal peptidase I